MPAKKKSAKPSKKSRVPKRALKPAPKKKAPTKKTAPKRKSTPPTRASMSTSWPKASTFQEVILRLQRFWADRGCVVVQPAGTEVGAGTLNKHTFLRVLGFSP